ncbi:hypothetical protein C7U57_05885 [Pseudomonas sp. R9.37]|nr:hypothetical protein C7U57_05885 [Pseudomonas sp. R9.37]
MWTLAGGKKAIGDANLLAAWKLSIALHIDTLPLGTGSTASHCLPLADSACRWIEQSAQMLACTL